MDDCDDSLYVACKRFRWDIHPLQSPMSPTLRIWTLRNSPSALKDWRDVVRYALENGMMKDFSRIYRIGYNPLITRFVSIFESWLGRLPKIYDLIRERLKSSCKQDEQFGRGSLLSLLLVVVTIEARFEELHFWVWQKFLPVAIWRLHFEVDKLIYPPGGGITL